MEGNDFLTERIIGCCFKVHSKLGPGFHEKIYHRALIKVLKEESLKYDTERPYDVFFESEKVGSLRLDLIIESKVIQSLSL